MTADRGTSAARDKLFPSSVKIGGLTYTVEVTPHISFGENYNGETLFRELKINVRPMEPDMMYRTFDLY